MCLPHGEGMCHVIKQMCLQTEHYVRLYAQLQVNHMRNFCMGFLTVAWQPCLVIIFMVVIFLNQDCVLCYSSYDYLREHFRSEHFLCEEGGCVEEKFTSVFRTQIDLKGKYSKFLGLKYICQV